MANGGIGVTTLTDGGVLLGSGTSAVTAMAVLADGEFIVGDGTTDPVAESGATVRTSLGLGTGDTVAFSVLTLTTDLAVAQGGTGASSAASAFTNLKQTATDSATGVVELATQGEVDTGTDTSRAITPATLIGYNLTKNYSVTHTSDTALATRAGGGSQIGSTLSNARIPTSGVIRVTILEAEFDETTSSAASLVATALDVGGTKVWAETDGVAGTAVDATITINTGVASRLIKTGLDFIFNAYPLIYSFDISAGSFPTGAQDVKIFMGDNASASPGEITLTGTTVTCRILVEVIDTT